MALTLGIISGSLTSQFSGSFTGSYTGDGSGLTNLPASSPFPFTGDAEITGSLIVSGSFNATTTGSSNTVIGSGSGVAMTTTTDNVLIGALAGNSLTIGGSNVMIGYGAGSGTTNSTQNVFIGYHAGLTFGTGATSDRNVCIGYEAGRGTTPVNADNNVFVGYRAGYDLRFGDDNIGIGNLALWELTDGERNVTIGRQAGANIVTGNYNILIGDDSGRVLGGASSNNIFIGEGQLGTSTMSNQLKIGNDPIVTISASLATGDIIFPSTASAAYFVGDGSQLTNIPSPSGKFGIANSSGEYTYYSDLSSSLQAANSGDVIELFTTVTESSDHVYHLKDGVDFNFNGNELFYSASAALDGKDIFDDNNVAVSCSFYNGSIRFTQGTGVNIFNRFLYIQNAGTLIKNHGFTWNVEKGSNYAPYYTIDNNGTIDGGKIIGSAAVFNYLIYNRRVLRNLEVKAGKMGIRNAGYLVGLIDNCQIYSYGGNATFESSQGTIRNSYIYAATGTACSAYNVYSCVVKADAGAGVTGARKLFNTVVENAGGVGVSIIGYMIGGSVHTSGDQCITVANSCEIQGVQIWNSLYTGPAIEIGNSILSNCSLMDDYPYSGQNIIEVVTGATSPKIVNCSFKFLNDSTLNKAITAVDDDTSVFYGNNTFINCTPTNPTKVTQAITNTPDAQGNLSINN